MFSFLFKAKAIFKSLDMPYQRTNLDIAVKFGIANFTFTRFFPLIESKAMLILTHFPFL